MPYTMMRTRAHTPPRRTVSDDSLDMNELISAAYQLDSSLHVNDDEIDDPMINIMKYTDDCSSLGQSACHSPTITKKSVKIVPTGTIMDFTETTYDVTEIDSTGSSTSSSERRQEEKKERLIYDVKESRRDSPPPPPPPMTTESSPPPKDYRLLFQSLLSSYMEDLATLDEEPFSNLGPVDCDAVTDSYCRLRSNTNRQRVLNPRPIYLVPSAMNYYAHHHHQEDETKQVLNYEVVGTVATSAADKANASWKQGLVDKQQADLDAERERNKVRVLDHLPAFKPPSSDVDTLDGLSYLGPVDVDVVADLLQFKDDDSLTDDENAAAAPNNDDAASQASSNGSSKEASRSSSTSSSLGERHVHPGSLVYVQSPEFGWLPGKLLLANKKFALVSVPQHVDQYGNGVGMTQVKVALRDYVNCVLPLQNIDKSKGGGTKMAIVADMVELPFLHEPAILYNLKTRHMSGQPYTRTGDVVIAMNPFQWFEHLYTVETRIEYARALVWNPHLGVTLSSLAPHVYEVSALAYKGLLDSARDAEYAPQSILVSGESGAGKTETVKICINHIAQVQAGPAAAHDAPSMVVQRVVDSNPLLEAFGNAKTRRNDNSSRFGKYLQLQFDMSHQHAYNTLVGSTTDVYLLEKSRVVDHDDQERTFHIFYQLLAAPDVVKCQFWNGLIGTDADSFAYVGSSDTDVIEGVHDSEGLQNTLRILELIGISGMKLKLLFKTIVTVLLLGNIRFEGDEDHSKITTEQELFDVAELMGVNAAALADAFTSRDVKARGEVIKRPLGIELAQESRDSLAKEIYGRAFNWLVGEINDCNRTEMTEKVGTIGLLDLSGFEHYEVNRFEQLCINYGNEKLQQKFIEDIYKTVQAEYVDEGIREEETGYDDNKDVLTLIEGRLGLLDLLDEESFRPRGNDIAYVRKIAMANKASPALAMVNINTIYEFGVRHYAGVVKYNANFFVASNNDRLITSLEACAKQSDNFIIAHHFHGNSKRRSNILQATVSKKYSDNMTALMEELKTTKSRYIRCIKPNTENKPAMFEHQCTLAQLRSAGVIDAITMSRSAFPNRMELAKVMDEFRAMWPKGAHHAPKHDPDWLRKDVETLLESALKTFVCLKRNKPVTPFATGKTKAFFRAGALEYLFANRLSFAAVGIQCRVRGMLGRRKYQQTRAAAIMVQCFARMIAGKSRAARRRAFLLELELQDKCCCGMFRRRR